MTTPSSDEAKVSQCAQLREEGKAQLCLEAAAAAVDAGAEDAEVLACKAWALACLNRYGEALEVLEAAAQKATATTAQQLEIRALRNQMERCVAFVDELAQRREYAAAQLQLGEQWFATTVEERMTACSCAALYEKRNDTLVFQKPSHGYYELSVAVNTRDMVFEHPMCNQMSDGNVYRKHRTLPVFDGDFRRHLQDHTRSTSEEGFAQLITDYGLPKPIGIFPKLQDIHHKPNVYQEDPSCDVWVMENALPPHSHNTLKALLDARAEATADFPMPMYQNIIDPNLLVQGDGLKSTWSASLFDVKEASSLDVAVALQLVAKELCNAKLPGAAMRTLLEFAPAKRPVAKLMTRVHDLDPADNALLHLAIEEVFNAAVPLLAELRRPALLLPGPLQAVVKAQRIYLEPGQEYEGAWHYDGKNEDIVAVAIYYYGYSPELEGGDLEFLAKEPYLGLIWDDNGASEDTVHSYYYTALRCRVPVGEGTLVVFSNYQFIHRVLRMVHDGSSSAIASRDFLLFFIVDQRCPLPSTEQAVPVDNRYELRDQLLRDQLKPSGTFGLSRDYVYSTGNGCVAQLGWMNEDEKDECEEYMWVDGEDDRGAQLLAQFATCPPTGRGLSWVFEEADEKSSNPESPFVELRRHQGPDASSDFTVSYVNVETKQEQATMPEEGIRGIIHEFPGEKL